MEKTEVNKNDEWKEFKVGLLTLFIFACVSLPAVFIYGAVGFIYTAVFILGLIASCFAINAIGSSVIGIFKGE